MTYELKDGQISIFKNMNATPENRKPPYTGTTKIEGKEYRVALWVQESKNGSKYFSGKVTEPAEDWRNQGAEKDQALDDEIPF